MLVASDAPLPAKFDDSHPYLHIDDVEPSESERGARYAQRVMDSTSDGVLVLTAAGACEYANDAAGRLLGWPADTLAGKPMHEMLHPGCGGDCLLWSPFGTAIARAGVEVMRTERGSSRPVDLRVSPVVQQGQVQSVVAMFTDATERLRLEQQQRDVVARLEALNVQQRDFLSTVNHELRTPLTSVMGYLDLTLEMDDLGEEARDYLEVVNRNAARLFDQVEDLLMIARLDSGQTEVLREPVSIAALVADAAQAIAPQAAQRSVAVLTDVDPSCGNVMGDPAQLDRVLLNLLSNGVKFSTDGGQVRVRAERVGAWVHVHVRDDGIGIPEGEQDRLFQKFFRSSISQRQATPGTGLGLSIVKAIVEEHGGMIAVTSAEGRGTAFAFTLPAV